MDFDAHGEMDVLRIFDNSSLGSYYKFLVKYEKEFTIRFSEEQEKVMEFISKKLANGKRIHTKYSNGYEYWYEYDTNGTLIHMNDSEGFEWKCSRKEITK